MGWIRRFSAAALAVAAITLFLDAPVGAQEEDGVYFAIVGFGDKTCTDGSSKLGQFSAEPFEVEACVYQDGVPLEGETLVATVAHVGGSIEEIEMLTDATGAALFLIVPLDAGETSVTVCWNGNCDWGSVSQDADNPPTPPAVASYFGPGGNDIGPSEILEEGTDDFWDPYNGGPAEPGLGDPAIDIVSLGYQGLVDGAATFDFMTVGDPCEVLPDAPFGQVSVFVTLADGGTYNFGNSLPLPGSSWAGSDGAPLPDVSVSLDPCFAPNTIRLMATGVDVPPGSMVEGRTWVSLDPTSSGYQDSIEGELNPGGDGNDGLATDSGSSDSDGESTGSSAGTSDDGSSSGTTGGDESGGGFPWGPAVIFTGAFGGVMILRTRLGGETRVEDGDPTEVGMADIEQYQDEYGMSTLDDGSGGDVDSTHLWNLAVAPELDAQERIKNEQANVVSAFTDWHGRFKEALVRFAEAYLSAWQGSDALRENQSDWRVHQIGAKAADLAVALIQLVRGVFMLGRGLAGWYRGRAAAQAAAKSADEVAALRTAADEALEASPQLKAFADEFQGAGRAGFKSYRDELVDVVMWGQDAGVDIVSIMAQRLDEMADLPVSRFRKIDVLIEQMIPHIMRGAGLTEAVPAVANAVENTAPLIRILATEGAPLTDEGAAAIRAFVQMVDETPGFWDDAGDMFVSLARGGDSSLTGEIAPLVSGDRLSNLRSLYDAYKAADGDFTKLPGFFRDALGPAKATAISAGGDAASAIPSALIQDGALGAGQSAAGLVDTTDPNAAPAQVGLGSVEAQMHQYGVTGDSFGGNVWDIFTAPIETTTGIYYSWGALDEINDILGENATDLSEMSSAWTELTNALGGLETMATGGASGHDSVEALEGALGDLDAAQQGLRDVYDGASDEWRAENQQMFDDKMAHIDKKKAAIQRLIDALRRLRLVIGRMKELLENLEQTPDGDRRTAMEWVDPALSEALSQVAFQLEGIGHEILATD